MKFCKNCGYGLENDVQLCPNCNSEMNAENTLSDNKLVVLSERIKINSIIWIVIGIFQVLCFFSPLTVIVGILNIISAVKGLKWSKDIFHFRVGLVKAYSPMLGSIITLLYNLIFGGVIGVVGSIYYLLCIRGYVMENKDYFNALK